MKKTWCCLGLISLIFSEKLPQKVVVCGVCKNVADRLPYSIKIMENIGNLCSDYRIIVYENNSTDQTPKLLQAWNMQNSKVLTISEQLTPEECKRIFVNPDWGNKNHDFFKPEPIARARNIVKDIAMSEQYKQFEYLIWIDMDFMIEPAYKGFIEIFTSNKEWDAIFAYSSHPNGQFYDWYAFRDHKYPLGPELLGNYWWDFKKTITLNMKDEWYPVYSAFGGCGIYKKSSIQGCQYSGVVTKDVENFYKQIFLNEPLSNQFIQKYFDYIKNLKKTVKVDAPNFSLPDIDDVKTGIIIKNFSKDIIWRIDRAVRKYPAVCEHVALHATMIANGHDKLFINPRLLFHYSGPANQKKTPPKLPKNAYWKSSQERAPIKNLY